LTLPAVLTTLSHYRVIVDNGDLSCVLTARVDVRTQLYQLALNNVYTRVRAFRQFADVDVRSGATSITKFLVVVSDAYTHVRGIRL